MRKVRDLTYRKEQCNRSYVIDYATRLVGKRVVVQMTDGSGWRSAWLLKVYPKSDRFQVKWTKEDKQRVSIRGLWRIHNATLFTAGQKPRPQRLHGMDNHARIRITVKPKAQEGKMATSKTKSSTKKGVGRPKGNGGIANLPETKRAAMAKKIAKLRTQKVKWDGPDGICAQVGISSALQGRELLRDYGNDDMVRERTTNGGGSKKASGSKTKASAAKAKAKPASKRKVQVKRGGGRVKNPS